MRKNFWRRLFLLLCTILCLTGLEKKDTILKAATEPKKGSRFDIEAELSLNNYAKIGRNSQMKVTVTNHGEDFIGLIQIGYPVNMDKITYQKPFSIASGETKVMEIPFRMQSGNKNIRVSIVDKEENVLGKIKIKVNLLADYEYLSGILTDNKQGMGYLTNYVKVTWLDKNSMPNTLKGMDALDRIYINEFQTANLSKKQYETLKAWVREGGDLVIGTGENAEKVLGIFQDDFLQGKIGENIQDGKAELSFEGEQLHQDQKGQYNIHSIQVGEGSIWIYDVNLTVPRKEWKKIGSRYISYQLNEQFKITEFPSTYDEDSLYMEETINNTASIIGLPNMFYYGVVFLIYVVSISRILYFVLKKYDKLEKTWVVIPALSAIFVIVVYTMGNSTRITDTFMKYRGSIVFSGEDDTKPWEKNVIEFSSPNNGDYTLAVPKGRELYARQGDQSDSDGDSTGEGIIEFYQGEENQYVSIKNVSAFESKLVLSEQTRNMGQGYESDIVSNQFQCKGTFTNHTGYTLKYAVFVVNHTWYILGDIKDGETIEINEKTEKEISEGVESFSANVQKKLFGTENSSQWDLEQLRYNSILLNEGFRAGDYNQYNGILFSCIDQKEELEKMDTEWGMNCDGITSCLMPVKIKYSYHNDVFIPDIKTEGVDVDGILDSDGSFDYTKTDTVDIEYTLEKGETLTGLYYLKEGNPSLYIKDYENDEFDGQVSAYNYKTKKYEMIFESGEEKSIKKVGDYVNSDNVLKIRVKTYKKVPNADEEAWEYLPVISLSKKKS